MLSEAKITERALLDCWTVSFVLNTDVGGLNSLSLCPSWKQEVPLLLKAVSSPFLFTRHPKLSKAFTEPRFQTHTWCWHFYSSVSLLLCFFVAHWSQPLPLRSIYCTGSALRVPRCLHWQQFGVFLVIGSALVYSRDDMFLRRLHLCPCKLLLLAENTLFHIWEIP